MLNKSILVLLVSLFLVPPAYAQKFTKKEQARREAREANYFCGASFTFTSGYVHSWMTNDPIEGSYSYGKSECWGNTNNHFDIGFLWDQSFSRQWGIQTGLFYTNKGGDHLYYYQDPSLSVDYGKKLLAEKTSEINARAIQLQSQARYFVPLSKHQRLSVNAGFYIDRMIKEPDGFGKWNLGPQVGLGYDLFHFSTSVTYQPGLYKSVTKKSDSRQSAICVNIGFRLWK